MNTFFVLLFIAIVAINALRLLVGGRLDTDDNNSGPDPVEEALNESPVYWGDIEANPRAQNGSWFD